MVVHRVGMKHRNNVPATKATVFDAFASREFECICEWDSFSDVNVLRDISALTWALHRLTSLNTLMYTTDVTTKLVIIISDITAVSSLLFIPNEKRTASSIAIDIPHTMTATATTLLELTFSM